MSAYISPRWDRFRSYFFKIGLIKALALCIVLINWNFDYSEPIPFDFSTEDLEIIDLVPRTPKEIKENEEVPPVDKKVVQKNFIKIDKIELIDDEKPEPESKVIPTTDPEEPTLVADSAVAKAPIAAPMIEDVPAEEDKIFSRAERMPIFGDCLQEDYYASKQCSEKALYAFIASRLKYPVIARENNIQGNVVLKFVVNKEGTIQDIKIVKDIGGGCGQAAVEVIQKMERWIPGKQNGRPVSVYFTMPVRFSLK